MIAARLQAATPEDFESARLGESVYSYMIRAFYGEAVESFGVEKLRLHKQGHGQYSWRNRYIVAYIITYTQLYVLCIASFTTKTNGYEAARMHTLSMQQTCADCASRLGRAHSRLC